MTVRLITSDTDLASLETAWNTLAGGVPFRSFDWLATWWKHYGQEPGRELFVPVVKDENGEPIGIAPWYLQHRRPQGAVVRQLGDGEVCTDHLSILAQPENISLVAEELAEFLAAESETWDSIQLEHVDFADPSVQQLAVALEKHGCLVSRTTGMNYWAAELPSNWEEYLQRISKSHRKQMRQAERRVLDSGRVRWHRVTDQAGFDVAWPILVNLHQRRRQSLGEPGCFASQTFHDFHRDVAQRLLSRGQLRLSWLELDGSPAAAEYHFVDSASTYAYQGGVDPDRLEDEPGRLSTILCLRAAINEGRCTFDFLRGDEPYKAHWRATPWPTCDYRILPNRRFAKLRGQALALADAMGGWVKSGMSGK